MWDREAKEAGERRKVFCASLADVFDPEAPDQWRSDLFSLIEQTENLDWLLLTKRPELGIEQFGIWQNINPEAARAIWFGISAEDQQRFDERADYLTDIRLAENITFVSAEPLLGDINLASYVDYLSADLIVRKTHRFKNRIREAGFSSKVQTRTLLHFVLSCSVFFRCGANFLRSRGGA